MAAATKKNFDFRMSKKVAELTQVVHMLFTRNHEKEVELEALKDAYEHEIDLVLKDARSKVDKLETSLRNLERKYQEETSQFQTLLTHELERKEEEWRKRFSEAEKLLQNEKKECQGVRDLLITAQKDIERLKRTKSDELEKGDHERDAQAREIHNLKAANSQLQQQTKELNARLAGEIDLKRANDRLQTEVCRLREATTSSDSTTAEMVVKIKELENEIRRLQRDLIRSKTPSDRVRQEAEMPSASFLDYDEEMLKMKRELEKYRMELRNREGNFNRMFTAKQPVFVDKKAGRFAASFSGFQNGGETPHFRYTRERTYHPGTMRSAPLVDEDLRALTMTPQSAPSSAASSMGVFPHLPPDGRETRLKTPKLVKPRPPLTRRMLSAKSGGH